MTVRVYLPLTSSQLAALVADLRLPGPHDGHTVTEALREAWPDGDEEQWEYAAMAAAGDASWAARGAGDQPRRYVVAVDVASVEPASTPDAEVTEVHLPHDVSWRNVASAHVDVEDCTEESLGEDLAWFANQEIAGLV